jgi:hypothetical protein
LFSNSFYRDLPGRSQVSRKSAKDNASWREGLHGAARRAAKYPAKTLDIRRFA